MTTTYADHTTLLAHEQQVLAWTHKELGVSITHVDPMQSGLGLRNYFRLHTQKETYILTTAPQTQLNLGHFQKVTHKLIEYDLPIPKIIAYNAELNSMIQTDLGHHTLLDKALTSGLGTQLMFYEKAVNLLVDWQIQTKPTALTWPIYEHECILAELQLFPDWYLTKHVKQPLKHEENKHYQAICKWLAAEICHQPYLLMHRDYMSTNLIISHENKPYIIDYQDAMLGPLSYDLISLLHDHYISLPQSLIDHLTSIYYNKIKEITPLPVDITSFKRWCLFTACQRHLKNLGVFARGAALHSKPQYLSYYPRMLKFLHQALKQLPELTALYTILQKRKIIL